MAEETNQTMAARWLQILAVGRRPRRTLARLGLLVAFGVMAILFFSFVVLPIRINGPSMFPTYDNGQINFVNRLAYLRSEPQRGDVVAIRFSGDRIMYIKRIVGLPGETIRFSQGRLFINDKPLDEPYVYPSHPLWESALRVLGPKEYYVVGDNRSMPFEYHEKGGAERKRILGKVVLAGKPKRAL